MSLQTPIPNSKLSKETISKATEALLKWMKSKLKNKQTQPLFEQDDFIYLILTLKKIPPKGRTNPYKIPLPTPLHPFDSSEELCLIFDDRPKPTNKLNSEIVKKKIQSENIPISKVIKLSKLKSDYRAFEAKRKLCSSYDMFFADKRVIPLLPKMLGKEFFKKKKIPIPVELTRLNWKEQIENCCNSAFFYMKTGTCCVVKVGKVSMSRDEIIDNVVAVVNGVVEIIPKKWANVRSFHLKLSESLALPIYQTVPDVGLKIDGVRKEEEIVKKGKKDKKGESGEESAGDGKEKSSGRKKKTRGRIHEVQYMDNDMDAMLDDIFSDKDEVENMIAELDSPELGSKKRKKTEKGGKDLKEKKGDGVKKKKKNVEVEEGENVDDDKQTDEVLVAAEVTKSAKSKTKKKKTGASLEGKQRKDVDDDEVVVDVPVCTEVTGSAKVKKSGDGKSKKAKDLLRTEVNKLEDDDEAAAGMPDLNEVTGSAKAKKSGDGKSKKVKALSTPKMDKLEDEAEAQAEGEISLSTSSDAKKNKKNKVGSGGIKLRSKKTKAT